MRISDWISDVCSSDLAVLELLRHPNVRLPGVVPYDQLGAWLSKFDVGLIQHLELELTRYMNPLTAYVYLPWNLPVVATAVANVDAVPGLRSETRGVGTEWVRTFRSRGSK